MIADPEHEHLKRQVAELAIRLGELDQRIDEDNDDARRSLSEAELNLGEIERIVAPD